MPGQSVRTCSRCLGRKKNGQRCSKTSCLGDYCWIHAQNELGLRVKDSAIQAAGKGLYATKNFKKGDSIAKYKGECMTREEIDRRYPGNTNADYGFCSGRNCVDAIRTNDGFARFANHKPWRQASAKLTGRRCDTFRLQAIKNIRADKKHPTEIFADYGPDYIL